MRVTVHNANIIHLAASTSATLPPRELVCAEGRSKLLEEFQYLARACRLSGPESLCTGCGVEVLPGTL